MIIYAQEKLIDTLGEIIPAAKEASLAIYKSADFVQPRYAVYLMVEHAGNLRLFTARLNGELVGYCAVIVDTSIHKESEILATSSSFYIRKDSSDILRALKFFRYIKQQLKNEGVNEWALTTTTDVDISPLFKRLGAELYETVHRLKLG